MGRLTVVSLEKQIRQLSSASLTGPCMYLQQEKSAEYFGIDIDAPFWVGPRMKSWNLRWVGSSNKR